MHYTYFFPIYVGLFLIALYWLYHQCQQNSISSIIKRVNQDSNFIFAESQYSEYKYTNLLTEEYKKVKFPSMIWYYGSTMVSLLILGFYIELHGLAIIMLQSYWTYEILTMKRYKFKAEDYKVNYLGRNENAVPRWELEVVNPKLKNYRPYYMHIVAFILSNGLFFIWLYISLFSPY